MQPIRRHFFKAIQYFACAVVSLVVALSLNHTALYSAAAQSSVPIAQAEHFVQQGVEAYQEGYYNIAITHWESALAAYSDDSYKTEQAITQTNLAKVYQNLGQFSLALTRLNEAATNYRDLHKTDQVGRIQIEQAQIYTQLGQFRHAIALLCLPPERENFQLNTESEIFDRLTQQCENDGAYPITWKAGDELGQIAALGSLGEAYNLKGDNEEAITVLKEVKQRIKNDYPKLNTYYASTLNSLGTAYARGAKISEQRAKTDIRLSRKQPAKTFEQRRAEQLDSAFENLDAARELSRENNDVVSETRIQLNLLQLHHTMANTSLIEETQQRLNELLGSSSFPKSRDLAFGLIALANSYKHIPTDPLDCYRSDHISLAKTWLERAEGVSSDIGDSRALSFAEGYLGHVHQCLGDESQALKLFQKAQWDASATNAADSEYLWHWLEGNLYESQGKLNLALETYDRAIHSLETIRVDILTATKDLQFDFRDAVEPLYRNTIKLQLQLVSHSESISPKQTVRDVESSVSLNTPEGVLKTVDALKLAQLQNYFGDDCQLTPIQEKEVIEVQDEDNPTATISSIVFPERTILIFSRADEQPIIEEIKETSEKIQEIAIAYLRAVKESRYDYQHTCNPQGERGEFVCDQQLYDSDY